MIRILTLLLSVCFILESAPYSEIQDQGTLTPLSPFAKEQQKAKIELPNGLKAYLISDPNAELSGAMMSVNVGSWEDPDKHPGLAHFLEHMLFLGTTKYPIESEYQKFISENGGQANAFTASNNTSYLFTVKSNAFPEAFSRFSSFFEEPLFNPSGVSRELNAIDQEYAKNIENDDIRLLYVAKDLTFKHHPFHKFNMGNSESLKSVSRDELKSFYKDHYSSHLMRLMVYSSLPLEELKEIVVKDLSAVPRNDHKPYSTTLEALGTDLSKKYVYIEPIKDRRTLSIFWELPARYANLKDEQPESVISFILGHEGQNSLLTELKREHLAESLACGGSKLGDTLFVMTVQIELTNQGLQDVDQVIKRTFQAIHGLQEEGVPPYLFEEIRAMNVLDYQYQSKEKEFMMLMKGGFTIHDEAFESYPEKTHVIQKFDPRLINKLLTKMTPENARIFVMAPSKLTSMNFDRQEPWLGVNYTVMDIPDETFNQWKNVQKNPRIGIPEKNPFIPDNLELVNNTPINAKQFPAPILIEESDAMSIYYAPDQQFGLPKVSWNIHLLTPKITPKNALDVVYGELYVKLLKEKLNNLSYTAQMAGLDYDLSLEKNGIKIQINGFSAKAPLLLKKIYGEIVLFEPTKEKFKVYKDSLDREYRNFAKNSPLEQSLELFKSMLYQDFVTADDKRSVMRKVTFESFEEWANKLYDAAYVQAMLYGNMSKEQGQEIAALSKETFNKGPYPKDKHFENRVIVLPQDQGPFFVESRTKSQGNVTLLGIEYPDFSFKTRAAQQILMQAIEQPFYSNLRTKQQTGYIVFSMGEEAEKKLFNVFLVQSNTHDNRDLLSRFEAFIEGYLQELGISQLTEEQFNTIRSSLVQKIEEPAKNIKEMGDLLDHLMVNYNSDFDWMNQRIAGMKALTYQEQLELTDAFLGRQNRQRLAILLNGEIPDSKAFSYNKARTWNSIRKISNYEAGNFTHEPLKEGMMNGYK